MTMKKTGRSQSRPKKSVAKAKAKLTGAIPSPSSMTQNNKIIFGDDDDGPFGSLIDNAHEPDANASTGTVDGNGDADDSAVFGNHDEVDEDAVEEVKGSAARESTQRLREAERTMTKKKKRKKKNDVTQIEKSSNEGEGEDDLSLSDDFFKMVDSERADQIVKAKKKKKERKIEEKKRQGKHTIFTVEDEHKLIGTPHGMKQNIEVVAIGGVGMGESAGEANEEARQLLISARLGSAPSEAAVAFARGSMSRGTARNRGSACRKRKGKDEEPWERSRKFYNCSRLGKAATLFLRRKGNGH